MGHRLRFAPLALYLTPACRTALSCALLAAAPALGQPAALVVRTFVSSELSSRMRCYWFETSRGTLLVDVPFLPSDGAALKKELEAHGAFPAGAVLFTGSNPLRSWGARFVSGPATRTWASRPAADALSRGFAKERDRWLRQGLPLSFLPPAAPVVTNTFSGSLALGVEGLTVRLSEAGGGGSAGATLVVVPETGEAFAGDLVWSRCHPRLDGVDVAAWKRALWQMKGLRLKRIYPGYGPVGGPDLIDVQLDYLNSFEETVRAFVRPGKRSLAAQEAAEVKRSLVKRYRDWDLGGQLDASIKAEYQRQRASLFD